MRRVPVRRAASDGIDGLALIRAELGATIAPNSSVHARSASTRSIRREPAIVRVRPRTRRCSRAEQAELPGRNGAATGEDNQEQQPEPPAPSGAADRGARRRPASSRRSRAGAAPSPRRSRAGPPTTSIAARELDDVVSAEIAAVLARCAASARTPTRSTATSCGCLRRACRLAARARRASRRALPALLRIALERGHHDVVERRAGPRVRDATAAGSAASRTRIDASRARRAPSNSRRPVSSSYMIDAERPQIARGDRAWPSMYSGAT